MAGEVRNLAHRAGSAAKEIKVLIDDSVREVEAGTNLGGNAGATMDETTQQNAALVDEASAASQAMQEQAARLAELVGMSRLAGAAQRLPLSACGSRMGGVLTVLG